MNLIFFHNWYTLLREEMHKAPANPLIIMTAKGLLAERDDAPDWVKMLAAANPAYLDEAIAEICNLEGV